MPELPDFSKPREDEWAEWRGNTALPPGTREDVIREAFCAGWQALADRLGNDHYVIFTEDGWTTEHSLDCRLSGQMSRCAVHAAVARAAVRYDPRMAGRWLVKAIDSEGLPRLERPEPEVPSG